MEAKARATGLFWLALVAAAVVWAIGNLPPVELPPLPAESSGWHMEQVMPWPDHILPAVTYTPGPDTRIYYDPGEMPPLPNCEELGIDDCRWRADLMESPSGDMIQVELREGSGKVVGRAELLKVQTSEYPELQALRQMGYREGWIARIEVRNVLRGNGLGRLMWRAGDAALKITSGGGAVRIFSDRAGWGQAIMKLVPKELIVLSRPPVWAYIIE